jgi:hypothetical protein
MSKRYRQKREKAEFFVLSTRPGKLAWCYFASGPLVALGFWIGGPPLAIIALLVDSCFCLLLYFYKYILKYIISRHQ